MLSSDPFSHDGANRLIGLDTDEASVSYSLDGVGHATNVVVDLASATLSQGLEYDGAERRTNQTSAAGTFVYGYHQHNGLLAAITNVATQVRVGYEYDVMDRVTNIVWRNGSGQIVRSFAYSYSSDGLITDVERESGSFDAEYAHDSLGRLTSGQGYGYSETYAWDLAGNPLNSTYGVGNRIYSDRYEYADSGCVTEIDLPSCPALDLNWNSQYQLTSIVENGVTLASYQYDALGRRAVSVSGGPAVHHVYDGAQVVADTDAAGNLLRSYTWAPGIDRLLAMTDHTGPVPVTYFPLTDHLGSVYAWLDESANVVERYEYNPWGKVVLATDGSGQAIAGSQIGNRYLWHGREYEWATHGALSGNGLYYFRARWYSPYDTYGRWLSKDPIGISGGLNQYVFCGGNPANRRDPLGLCDVREEFTERVRVLAEDTERSLVPMFSDPFSFGTRAALFSAAGVGIRAMCLYNGPCRAVAYTVFTIHSAAFAWAGFGCPGALSPLPNPSDLLDPLVGLAAPAQVSVNADMLGKGYDPRHAKHVYEYWRAGLTGVPTVPMR